MNGAPVPHSPLDSHTSPGFAASQFHTTSRLVGDGHLSGGTSRRQMPQDNPASQVPHAGGEGGGAVASLKARAMRQEVMRRVAVGDIPGRTGRCRRRCPTTAPAALDRRAAPVALRHTTTALQPNLNLLTVSSGTQSKFPAWSSSSCCAVEFDLLRGRVRPLRALSRLSLVSDDGLQDN